MKSQYIIVINYVCIVILQLVVMSFLLKNLIKLSCVAVLLSSCAIENINDLKAASADATIVTANIEYSDLVGDWDLSLMQADRDVDLNKDGTFNSNLLLETTCFDPMSINFYDDKTFSSVNARLDFEAGTNNDEFFCMGNRTDTGTWEIEGDVLTLNVEINGSTYIHTKTLTFNQGVFSFSVSKTESNQYVEDPGDTSVSQILVVELEYTQN
ncbi:lipocalin family protein [Gillisia sp. Q332]|uniref:lipocalin family protein n=1 Tax=Gillisia xinjiangensis TaxID=3384765 RepID=UPI003919CB60